MHNARSDPGYVDQVIRREAYEADHPDVEISLQKPMWQAIVPLPEDGKHILLRRDLRTLLDSLELLDLGAGQPA